MRFLVLQKRAIGGKAGFKAALVVEISGQLFVHYFSKRSCCLAVFLLLGCCSINKRGIDRVMRRISARRV